MKKALLVIFTLVMVLGMFNVSGCKPKEPVLTDDMAVDYIYVTEIGDDWIYGDDTKIICGKNHGFNICSTAKVIYYKTDLVEEHGILTVEGDVYTHQVSYDKVIKRVIYSRHADPNKGEPLWDKPVIYLYPENTSDVFVRLDYDGYLTQTIPPYSDGWHVTAYPDGTLIGEDGEKYPYLFWEGVPNNQLTITEGFCVAGSETREFLERILPEIGLAENEYTEFIDFWLPRMENNEYNLIQFFGEEYTESAKLEITPAPDSVLRVFMAYRSSDEYVQLTEQTFTPFVREGFTVVEWGGTCLD